jgi:hypothetical protein
VANPLPTQGRPFPTRSAAHDQCWPRQPLVAQRCSCWQGMGMGTSCTHLYSPAKSSASAAKCGHFSNPTKKPGSSTNARHEEAAIVSIGHPTRHRDRVIQATHRGVHVHPPPSALTVRMWCSQNESVLLQHTARNVISNRVWLPDMAICASDVRMRVLCVQIAWQRDSEHSELRTTRSTHCLLPLHLTKMPPFSHLVFYSLLYLILPHFSS